MEWVFTIVLLSIAAYLIFTGNKKSRKKEIEEQKEIKKKWDKIKREQVEKKG